MTQEEKDLLLKDLCARLPYDTIISVNNGKYREDVKLHPHYIFDWDAERWDAKPYLRPMSSMTEEELNECICQSGIEDIECPNWQDIPKEKQFEVRLNHAIAVFLTDSNNVDWLNAHHFDYRCLISMELAIEAPEGMYNN